MTLTRLGIAILILAAFFHFTKEDSKATAANDKIFVVPIVANNDKEPQIRAPASEKPVEPNK